MMSSENEKYEELQERKIIQSWSLKQNNQLVQTNLIILERFLGYMLKIHYLSFKGLWSCI